MMNWDQVGKVLILWKESANLMLFNECICILSNLLERDPDIPELVGWIFIYPQVGILKAIPTSCPLPMCLIYKSFADVGTKYITRDNCVDSGKFFHVRR
jgi:hypothetical protein